MNAVWDYVSIVALAFSVMALWRAEWICRDSRRQQHDLRNDLAKVAMKHELLEYTVKHPTP